MKPRLVLIALLCILATGLAACRAAVPEPTATPLATTATPSPVPATATATSLPTATPRPAVTPTPLPTHTRRAASPTPESLSEGAIQRTRAAQATAELQLQTSPTSAPEPAGTRQVQATATATVEAGTVVEAAPPVPAEVAPMIPLTEMGTATYYGLEGGLYPGGRNEMPPAHAEEGLRRAQAVAPLNSEGVPDANGKYVMLSLGMSNTAMEFCAALSIHVDYNARPCTPYSFMARSAADAAVNRTDLVILNGARGGQVGDQWNFPAHQNYDRIRDELLATRGLSEEQVQVVWVKVVDRISGQPTLPSEQADAYRLTATLADIVRSLKARYPNLQQVYLSSRIYAGYATELGEERHPEPYAYESGFAIKWLIEAQIRQMESGQIDRLAGDLDYNSVAPWLAWGPYLWADGSNPRSDGLVWVRADFSEDGVHPAVSGRTKVAAMLLDFFKSSPYSRCWFLTAADCR
jgi:hypothetical protein